MEGPRKSESLRLLSVRIEIGNLKDYVIFVPLLDFPPRKIWRSDERKALSPKQNTEAFNTKV